MANCCNADRVYMGTGRTYMRQPARESVRSADCGCPLSEPAAVPRTSSPCGCDPENLCEGLPLVTSYMAPQPYTGLLCGETALSRGSSFNNLYQPWTPGCNSWNNM